MDNKLKWFSIGLIILMSLDVISTSYLLNNGMGKEGNPMLKDISENVLLLLGIKFIGTVIIISVLGWAINKNYSVTMHGMRLITIIMLFVVINNIGVGIASAETGSISHTDFVSKTYTSTNAGVGYLALNFSDLNFYKTGYNSITFLSVYSASITMNTEGEVTTCTIISGGSGTCIFSYSKNAKTVNYWFYNTTITGNVVKLSFSNQAVRNNVSTPAGGGTGAYVGIGTDRPVGLRDTAGSDFGVPGVVYNTDVQKYAGIGYTVTYPFANVYTIYITKSQGSIPTLVKIQNDTGIQYQESTYTSLGFNQTLAQTNGIYINMTFVDGYILKLINATGSSYVEEPTPEIDPITGAGIVFNKETYSIGETVKVSWARTPGSTPFLYQDAIFYGYTVLPSDVEGVDCDNKGSNWCSHYIIQNPSDTGNFSFRTERSGEMWTVFMRCFLNCEISNVQEIGYGERLAIDWARTIPDSPAYLLVNSTVSTKTNVPIVYNVGRDLTGYISGNKSLMMLEIREYVGTEFISPKYYNLLDKNGTIYHIFPTAGKYKVSIFDYLRGEQLAEKIITAIYQPDSIVLEKIKTSYITSDKSLYYFGEPITGSYGIDDTNYSNYNIVVALMNETTGDMYCSYNAGENFDLGTGTFLYDFVQQSGNYYMGCEKGIGLTNITVYRVNNSSLEKITSVSFNVSSTNLAGYGLKVKNMGCQKFSITAISPVVARLEIIDYAGKIEKYYNFTNTLSIVYQAKTKSQYTFNLYDPSHTLQISQIVPGSSDCIDIIDPLPGWEPGSGGTATTCGFWDGWVRNLAGGQGVNDLTRFMFALVVIGMITAFVAIITKNLGAGIIVGFFPYAFFVFMSLSTPCGQYMPVWTAVFIAVIVGVKMRWF